VQETCGGTAAFLRPEVDRGGSRKWGGAVFLRRLAVTALASRKARMGRIRGPLRSEFGPAKILVQTGGGRGTVPVPKVVKRKAAQPAVPTDDYVAAERP
jgi:hypothetical protein